MILRRKMWAVHQGQVGIVHELKGEAVEFHVVNDKGETVAVRDARVAELEDARLKDIPEPRRPSAKHGARLGYE